MAAAVQQPVLHHHRPALVANDRAGVGPSVGQAGVRAFDALTSLDAPTIPAAFDGWTMLSASPWKTMVRTRGASTAPRGFRDRRPREPALPRIAAKAEGRSVADS